jgi:hypothetical protein
MPIQSFKTDKSYVIINAENVKKCMAVKGIKYWDSVFPFRCTGLTNGECHIILYSLVTLL